MSDRLFVRGQTSVFAVLSSQLLFLFNIPQKGHVRHYRCITALCVVFKGSANGSSVRDDRLMLMRLRFISFYLLHHAAPSGRSAISVSHLCKQASAHVYTCVLIKQPCAHKVRAQHTCMHAVDKRAGEHSDYLCTVKTVAGGAV